VLIASAGNLQAAELRLLAGGAMSGVWAAIKPLFEQASGHKLEIFFGTTPNLMKEATSGKPFDVGVVPVEVMQDASARANFVAGPTIDIAHVGLGVAVRSGREAGNRHGRRAQSNSAQRCLLRRSPRAPPVIESQGSLIDLESPDEGEDEVAA